MKRITLLLIAAVFLLGSVLAFSLAASAETESEDDEIELDDSAYETYSNSVSGTINNSASSTLGDTAAADLLQQWYQLGALLRANGAYPFVELAQGNTGYEVTALQTRLAELGYYRKEIVDYFGNGTYNAMAAFEKDYGLPVNGVASVADQQVLFADTAVTAVRQTTTTTTGNTTRTAPDATSGATSNQP